MTTPTTHDRRSAFSGHRCLVIGMARSGRAAARMLVEAGARVFVSDAADEGRLVQATAELAALKVPFETGGHTIARLDETDCVVVSPGVSASNALIVEAMKRGIPIISEIEAAFRVASAPVLAITGSNGKTTTTSWLGAIYEGAGRTAQVGGNIGRPFSDFALQQSTAERAILEISTFQLEYITEFRPHIAAILNLSPDHLDRHGSFDEYVRLKFRLLENQSPHDIAVLNADDARVVAEAEKASSGAARRWWFSAERPVTPGVWLDGQGLRYEIDGAAGMIPGSDQLIPPGDHNRMNAAAAVAIALADGLTAAEITAGLTRFAGVAHRIEFVDEIDGVRFVNDSKATNPDSVAKALQSFDRPLVVIMGGLDKGTAFTPLAELLRARARALIFTGKAAGRLHDALGTAASSAIHPEFADAFRAAAALAQAGDVVLLSPGCASFDQFDNYEHRGETFKELVARWKQERGA